MEQHISSNMGLDIFNILHLGPALLALKQGKVIAYPTESMYGFGCDPFNINAVTKLLRIKQRHIKKGFILIGANFQQLESLVQPIDYNALNQVFSTWPGPFTWVFPASSEVPEWIRGANHGVAVRVTNHPIAKSLCEQFRQPIISTSANQEGFPPARDEHTLRMTLKKVSDSNSTIDYIVSGKIGDATKASEIRDAVTGKVLRKG